MCTFNNKSLLSLALVIIQGANGQRTKARVILDSCAEDSFISEALAQNLSLQKTKTEVICSGMEENQSPLYVQEPRRGSSLILLRTFAFNF